ncbi:MAG: DUF1553 domain-containing protein [Verrucomicrobia bacterium]|nr:DUF1553 domain-containing protein [Verrucomicrobiota bacterium]
MKTKRQPLAAHDPWTARRFCWGGTRGLRVLALRGLLLATLAFGSRLPATEAGSSVSNAWWALQPLRSVLPPRSPETSNPAVANPIDGFIRGSLRSKGLIPAPEADRRVLLRRLSFDLTGLGPTPEEMDRFVADAAPDAYERAVDRLLASPRYGERWARHWMDVAHFAETHGHDQDRIRTNAWPYRDYLIASFNSDKPYSRFVQEQVAGDVMYPDDSAVTVALGFLAAGPWDESSLRDIREDTLDRQMGRYLDRDDILTTVMQTFASVTVQCARCHDHKFDPVTQRDYYGLQAVFSGVDRANRPYDSDPAVHRQRRELLRHLALLNQGDRSELAHPETQAAIQRLESARKDAVSSWSAIAPDTFLSASGARMERQADGSFFVSGRHGPTDIYTLSVRELPPRVTAVRLEVMPDDRLPQKGPGREANGNLHLSEFQVRLFLPGASAAVDVPMKKASADYNQPGWIIDHSLDGDEKSAWGIHPQEGERHHAVFELASALEIPKGAQLVFVLKQLHGGHCIGRFRLSISSFSPSDALAALPGAIDQILAKPKAERSSEEAATLATTVMRHRWEGESSQLPAPAYVYAAASDFIPDGGLKPSGRPRPVHILKRGEITQPLGVASPGALSCVSVAGLPAFPSADSTDEGLRRAALARWLTHPENPLTWRSIVNRVWHHHFGRGLAGTPNDFGRMGDIPTHPELLDWLATWFRDDAHGSMKQLHRLVVTSQTYRQESRNPSTPSDVDPENRLLARMNRARLDAEQIRDTVLQISGRLDLRMGGPSDHQFDLQPGIHVTPRVDYTKFNVDDAAGRRRGVYRFLFRTLPDPFMDALDCPAGDQWMPVRNAQVTIQQALGLWNSAFMTRQCEHFAHRLEQSAADVDAQVREAFRWVFNRPPARDEAADFTAYARRHGLANLARLLFNSNEFVFLD